MCKGMFLFCSFFGIYLFFYLFFFFLGGGNTSVINKCFTCNNILSCNKKNMLDECNNCPNERTVNLFIIVHQSNWRITFLHQSKCVKEQGNWNAASSQPIGIPASRKQHTPIKFEQAEKAHQSKCSKRVTQRIFHNREGHHLKPVTPFIIFNHFVCL